MLGARAATLRASLAQGVTVQPDAYAKTVATAAQLGVDPGLVMRNQQRALANAKLQGIDVDGLTKNHPELAEWLSNRDNAALAHQEVPGLTALDHSLAVLDGRTDVTGSLPAGFVYTRDGTIAKMSPDGKTAEPIGDRDALIAHLRQQNENDAADEIEHQAAAARIDQQLGALAGPAAVGANFLEGMRDAWGRNTPEDQANFERFGGQFPRIQKSFLFNDLTKMAGSLAAQGPMFEVGAGISSARATVSLLNRARELTAPILGKKLAEFGTEQAKVVLGMAPANAAAAAKDYNENGSASHAALDFLISSGTVGAIPMSAFGQKLFGIGARTISEGDEALAAHTMDSPEIRALDEKYRVQGPVGPNGERPGLSGENLQAYLREHNDLANKEFSRRLGKGPAEGPQASAADRAGANQGNMGVARGIIASIGLQATQGAVQSLGNDLNDALVLDKPLDPMAVLARMGTSGAMGGVLGAAFGLGPAIGAKHFQEATAAKAGMEYAEQLGNVIHTLQQSDLAKNAPEAMQSAMKAMSPRSGNIYMQAKEWQEHWLAEGEDPVAHAEAAGAGPSFREAQATGGEMQIPALRFMQEAAKAKDPTRLVQSARAASGAPSAAEGHEILTGKPDEIAAQYKQLGEAMAEEQAKGSPESDQIHDEVLGHIMAAQPSYTPEQADRLASVIATTYGVNAKIRGKSALDTFRNEFPLEVLSSDKAMASAQEVMDRVKAHADAAVTGANAPDMAGLTNAVEGLRTAAEGAKPDPMAASADVLPQTEQAVRESGTSLQQQGIPVPDNATGLHRATTLRGLWKEAHGGKMPAPGDKLWEHLVRMSDAVDRANAAKKSGVDPTAKTERIVKPPASVQQAERLFQPHLHHHHGGDDAVEEMHDAEDVLKQLGPERTAEELRLTLEADPHIPLIKAENVPYGMGMDPAGTKIFVDPDFRPAHVSESGKDIDTIATTRIHEITETRWMNAGHTYEESHAVANAIESAYLLDKGFSIEDVRHYEKSIHPMLRKTRKWTGEPPAELNRKPYAEEGELGLLHEDGKADNSHLQPETKAWLDAQPADVQQRLQESVDYFKANPDPKGELGNLQMLAQVKPRQRFNQGDNTPRGYIEFGGSLGNKYQITLGPKADVSTVIHELGHFWLDVFERLAQDDREPASIREDFKRSLRWLRGQDGGTPGGSVKPVPYSIETDAKHLRDLLIGKSGSPQVGSAISAKPFLRVFGKVVRAAYDPKVAEAVIASLPVDVVDVLGRHKLSAEEVLHDPTMLQKAFTVDTPSGVAIPIEEGRALATLLESVAKARAERSGVADSRGADVAGDAAVGAGDNGHDEEFEGLLSEWKALPVEERTARHEKFADGLEDYFMEGKAPSDDLRPLFQSIKNWMLKIYSKLRGVLSDEVRGVFDRMLVAGDTVDAVAQRQGMEPVITQEMATKAGWGAEKFAAYAKRAAELAAQAKDKAQRDVMREYRKKLSADYRAKREVVKEEATQAVADKPVYAALSALQDGEGPKGEPLPERDPDGIEVPKWKLDKAELVARYGDGILEQLPGPKHGRNPGKPVYALEGGLSLDRAAELLGYKSGDELVRDLRDAPARKAAVEADTNARMAAAYPDAIRDGKMPEDAMDALHTKGRADLEQQEMEALAKLASEGAKSADKAAALEKAAKADSAAKKKVIAKPIPLAVVRSFAKTTIGKRAIKDLNPAQYREAEKIAHESMMDSIGQGDYDAAFAAKQRKVLNGELYRAAKDALDKSNAVRDYIASTDRPAARERTGKAGGWEWTVHLPDGTSKTFKTQLEAAQEARANGHAPYERTSGYLEQMDAIRERYEFAQVSQRRLQQRQTLRDWIADQQAKGRPVAIPKSVLDDITQRNWRELSVENLHDVGVAIRNIDKLARLENEWLAAQRKGTYTAGRDDMVAAIMAHWDGKNRAADESQHVASGFFNSADELINNQYRMPDIIARMDGHKAGGVLFDQYQRPLDEAVNRHIELKEDTEKAWNAILDEFGTSWADNIRRKSREAIEVSPGNVRRLSRWSQIMIAANWGNEGNRQRLMDGHRLKPAEVMTIIDRLDAKEKQFVERLWEIASRRRSEIGALEERVHGEAPEWVQPSPFTNHLGTWKGGYFPIMYKRRNSAVDLDATKMLGGKGAGYAMTSHGYVEERTGSVGLPLKLEIGAFLQHLDKVDKDVALREALMDANKLLNDKVFTDAITKTRGEGVLDQFNHQIKALAGAQDRERRGFEGILGYVRQGANSAMRAFNVAGSLVQLAGLPFTVPTVGLKYWMKALPDAFNPVSHHWMEEQDATMRTRNSERGNLLNSTASRTSVFGPLRVIPASTYLFMNTAWRVLDGHAWFAAYYKAMDEFGGDMEKAKAIATSTMVRTQGATHIKDQAQFMRGGELSKVFTNNMGWASANFNLMMGELQRYADKQASLNPLSRPGDAVRLASSMAAYLVVCPMIYLAAKQWMSGQSQDNLTSPDKIAREALYTVLSSMPIAREAGNAIEEPGSRSSGLQGASGISSAVNMAREAGNAFEEQKAHPERPGLPTWAREAIRGSGLLFHGIPAGQILKSLDGFMDAEEKGTSPVRGALFGKTPKP